MRVVAKLIVVLLLLLSCLDSKSMRIWKSCLRAATACSEKITFEVGNEEGIEEACDVMERDSKLLFQCMKKRKGCRRRKARKFLKNALLNFDGC